MKLKCLQCKEMNKWNSATEYRTEQYPRLISIMPAEIIRQREVSRCSLEIYVKQINIS